MKIMFEGRYTTTAWAGVNQSAQARMAATAALAESVGGSVDAMYWCPGDEWDFVLIVSGIDASGVMAIKKVVGESGAMVSTKARVLLDADEFDAATPGMYAAPGS